MKRRNKILEGRPVENKKLVATVYVLLRLSVVGVLIAQLWNRDFENAFLCVLTLILFMLPSAFERRLKIDLPDTLEIVILLFIYAAEILGEIRAFYTLIPNWDTWLHTLNGFLCAAIGFSLVDILNRHKKAIFSLSPLYLAIVAFCFSMTVGVMWEFFEFSVDQVLGFDMQKDTVITAFNTVNLDPEGGVQAVRVGEIADVIIVHQDGTHQTLGLGGYLDVGLYDTIEDLFVNFVGALAFSILGYFYVKSRGKRKFARRFIPTSQELSQEGPPSQEVSPTEEEPPPKGWSS